MRTVGVLSLLLLAGCFLPSFERDEASAVTSTVSTGGGGAGGSSATTGLDFCESAAFPAAPMSGSGGGADLDLAFALHTVELGENDVGKRPGFDLDRVCSCCTDCKTAADACTLPSYATAGAACDADDAGGSSNLGRDNALAKVLASFGQLGSQLPVGSDSMTQRIDDGLWTVLIRVSDYNGLPDDDQVSVSLFTTDGIAPAMPKWDGTDVWPIRNDSLAPNYPILPDPRDAATVLNAAAYVTGGRLVGVFDGGATSTTRLSLNLPGGFTLTLTTAIFSADLEKTATGWRLGAGTMGGIWNTADIFKSLSAVRPPLCTDDAAYAIFTQRLCQFVDIRSGTPSPQPCDALSFGLAFTADPIVFGAIELAGIAGPGCPMATNPAFDSCGP